MKTGYVLYNPISGTGDHGSAIDALKAALEGEVKFIDVTGISDYAEFFGKLDSDDYVVISGGDGTLNRFANNISGMQISQKILYFPAGSGNDFARDLDQTGTKVPFVINEYLKDLPTVTVNGKDYRFLNGVGYGIDGYCCEVGDEMRKIPNKKVDYTGIAIKGLLFHFKPVNGVITVDGVRREFKKIWLAPTMFGRFYGGGMNPAPKQRRDQDNVSVMVFFGSGKLKSLIMFPSLFKGEHVKYEKNIQVFSGKEITVEFEKPTALQIDGETILGVTAYTAKAPVAAKETATV